MNFAHHRRPPVGSSPTLLRDFTPGRLRGSPELTIAKTLPSYFWSCPMSNIGSRRAPCISLASSVERSNRSRLLICWPAVELVVVEDVTLEPSEQHSRDTGPPERVHETPHRLGIAPAADECAGRESQRRTSARRRRGPTTQPSSVKSTHCTPGVSDTSGQPIGRGDRAACARCTRCGNCRAPAAAAPPGRRSRRARVGSGEAPG